MTVLEEAYTHGRILSVVLVEKVAVPVAPKREYKPDGNDLPRPTGRQVHPRITTIAYKKARTFIAAQKPGPIHQTGAVMSAQQPSPALFFDTVNAFERTEALRTAIELDLFTPLADRPQTAAELANACQAAPRGVRILADYLTILGFLRKHVDRYELTPDSAVFLNRRSPAYLGSTLDFLLTPKLRECFQQLTAAVRRGGTAVSDEGTVSYDNPIWVDFARAMVPLMQQPARLLTDLIGGDTQQPLRVLDVAAGHGLYGITVALRYPQSHISALDWPNVLAVASENARRAGVAERHALRPGSAFEVDWGGPHDIVLLTNFLHHFDVPTCEQIAAKAYAALAPGGRALTLEFIPEPDRVTPPGTATFALTMLATTAHGDAYTFAEYQQIFAKAGFQRSEFHPLPPTMQQAVVSYKAG
jgi:2-polyprenyl-3-methyl-5-hydroxy-6-metoxy-1,4-benzoquinol methylase